MMQVYSPEGEVIPVTLIEAGPCAVIQKKTAANDGYAALQLGFLEKNPAKMIKPLQGHFKKLGGKAYTVLKEFRFDETDSYQVGDQITLDMFNTGDKVVVCGISKGKGYAGNIKRWGFNRGPMSHGSKFHRVVGSIGSSAYPSHVFKGKKMPGHMGSQKLTMRNLEIVEKRTGENILFIKGAVPGGKNGIVTIYKQ